MITQIYTAQTPEEAVSLAALGVEHVGVTVSNRGLPGEVGVSMGQRIVAAIGRSGAKSVALTVETDLAAVEAFAAHLLPDILHLCGDTELLGPAGVAELRHRLSGSEHRVDLMQAIPMTGVESIDIAIRFAPHVDWLILDSVTSEVEGIGAAGVTHDWALSRQIVDAVAVPVILAGGLGPDNVADAIAAVRPAGVDSLTRTNVYNRDGTFSKDLALVELFVANST